MERFIREERELLAILDIDLVGIIRQKNIPKSDEGNKEELREKKEV